MVLFHQLQALLCLSTMMNVKCTRHAIWSINFWRDLFSSIHISVSVKISIFRIFIHFHTIRMISNYSSYNEKTLVDWKICNNELSKLTKIGREREKKIALILIWKHDFDTNILCNLIIFLRKVWNAEQTSCLAVAVIV